MKRKRRTTGIRFTLPEIAVPVGPTLHARSTRGRSPLDPRELLRYAVTKPAALVASGLVLTSVWRLHQVIGIFSPLRLPAILAVLAAVLLLKARNRRTVRVALTRPYTIALLLLIAWTAVGVPAALDPLLAWDILVADLLRGLLFCLFLMCVLSRRRILAVLVFANLVGMSVGLFDYAAMGMPATATPYTMYDRNDLALILNMALPLLLWFILEVRGLWIKALCIGLAGFAVVAIIATTSRGGLLAMGAVVVVAILRFRDLTAGNKGVLVAAVAVLLAFAPAQYWDRMGTMLDIEEDYNVTSETGRLQIWRRGMGYFLDHPFTGVGVGNFQLAERTQERPGIVADEGKAAHNGFVQVLAETGFPGLLAWMVMLGSCLMALVRAGARFEASRDPEDRAFGVLCQAVFLSLVAFLVGGFFLTRAFSTALLQLVAMTAGLELVSERSEARYKVEPRPRAVPKPKKIGRHSVGDVIRLDPKRPP